MNRTAEAFRHQRAGTGGWRRRRKRGGGANVTSSLRRVRRPGLWGWAHAEPVRRPAGQAECSGVGHAWRQARQLPALASAGMAKGAVKIRFPVLTAPTGAYCEDVPDARAGASRCPVCSRRQWVGHVVRSHATAVRLRGGRGKCLPSGLLRPATNGLGGLLQSAAVRTRKEGCAGRAALNLRGQAIGAALVALVGGETRCVGQRGGVSSRCGERSEAAAC
jgi:hypothetical protein